MNLSYILAFVTGAILVVYGILESGTSTDQVLSSFINLPALYIAIGGAVTATVMSVPFRYLRDIPRSLKILFKKDRSELEEYILVFEELSKEARMNGILSLENKIESIDLDDSFLDYCIMLVVDAVDPHKVREKIEKEIDNIEARHSYTWKVFDTLASFGPAFGMIGTLIGLINMLANMDPVSGSESLGKGMSVALVTTLYGSLLTNFICAPISNRLKIIHDEELILKELVMEGALAIQEGTNPAFVRDRLSSYLSKKAREAMDEADNEESKKDAPKRGR